MSSVLFGVSRMEKVIHYGAVRVTPKDSAVVASSGRFDTGGPANRYSTDDEETFNRSNATDLQQPVYKFLLRLYTNVFFYKKKNKLNLKMASTKNSCRY